MAKPNFGVSFAGANTAAPSSTSGSLNLASTPSFAATPQFAAPPQFASSTLLPGVAPSGGGGFFGGVEHFVGKTLTNLEDAAINLPAGLLQFGEHPIGTLEQMPGAIYQDLRHPGRNPGFTALDLLGIFGGAGAIAGRLGEAGAIAARAGELPAEISTLEDASALGRRAQFLSATQKGSEISAPVVDQAVPPDQWLTRTTATPKPEGQQILRALIHGPAPEERLLQPPGGGPLQAGWNYSKNPAIKLAQKKIDEAYLANPEASLANRLVHPYRLRSQDKRIESAIKAEQTIQQNIGKEKANALLKKWGKAPSAFQLAGRMKAEITTPEVLTKMHTDVLKQGGQLNPRMIAETQRRLALIPEAAKYLENKTITSMDGESNAVVPEIREHSTGLPGDPTDKDLARLRNYVDDMRNLSKTREYVSKTMGVLSNESAIRRILGPLNYSIHGSLPPNLGTLEKEVQAAMKVAKGRDTPRLRAATEALRLAHGQMSFEDLVHDNTPGWIKGDWAEELANRTGAFRIPYEIEKAPRFSFAGSSYKSAYLGRKVKTPESYLKEFEGGVLKHGGGDLNAAKLLAHSYMETHKFVALKNMRASLLASSRATPEGMDLKRARIIRTDEEVPGAPNYAQATEQALMGKPMINEKEAELGGLFYEGIKDHMLPTKEEVMAELTRIGGGLREKFFGEGGQQFQPVPGYRWIDERMLGFLGQKDPLWGAQQNPIVRSGLKLADVVNNASKFAILYLKPAYALPNALGNLFLNFIQQGFLAPLNLGKATILLHRLDPETIARMDTAMGGGFAEPLKPIGISGRVSSGMRWTANMYGKVVDTPFRRASFLHEARLQGFSSPAELKALTHDTRFAPDMEKIANRASEEILNYERMSPAEQSVLRRLVFFYPWLKASSRYISYFAKNHPVAAGLTAPLGQQGGAAIEKQFGALPSFMEGELPFGGTLGGSPASFAILQQPADLEKMVRQLVQNNPVGTFSAAQNLAPFDSAALSLLTLGKASSLPHKAGEAPYKVAWDELTGGLPLLKYIQSFGPARPNALYPSQSPYLDALRYFVTGSLGPRQVDIPKANYMAWAEAHPQGITGG